MGTGATEVHKVTTPAVPVTICTRNQRDAIKTGWPVQLSNDSGRERAYALEPLNGYYLRTNRWFDVILTRFFRGISGHGASHA